MDEIPSPTPSETGGGQLGSADPLKTDETKEESKVGQVKATDTPSHSITPEQVEAQNQADQKGIDAIRAKLNQADTNENAGTETTDHSDRVNIREWLDSLEQPTDQDLVRREQLDQYLRGYEHQASERGIFHPERVQETLEVRKEFRQVEEKVLNKYLKETLPKQIEELLENPRLLVMSYAPDRRTGDYRMIGEENLVE